MQNLLNRVGCLPVNINAVCSSDDQAGGGPATAHFLCFAKESKQRKATQKPGPCGVPSDAQ